MSAARGVRLKDNKMSLRHPGLTLNSDFTFIPGWNMLKGKYEDSIFGLQSITVEMAKKKKSNPA